MLFEEGGIYHVFNQGNNRRKVFFKRENYLFFLKKIRQHVFPYADILAWCMMPNHFHLMIYVFSQGATGQEIASRGATSSRTPTFPGEAGGITSRTPTSSRTPTFPGKTGILASQGATSSRTPTFPGKTGILASQGATSSRTLTLPAPTFNQSLGIMLASYARAINLQEKFSGSLFRKGTKAVCLNEVNGISPSWQAVQGAFQMNVNVLEDQYPQICFDYIHNNPVSAGLVKSPGDWEFSSFLDYCGMRDGTLVNKDRAKEIGMNWNV